MLRVTTKMKRLVRKRARKPREGAKNLASEAYETVGGGTNRPPWPASVTRLSEVSATSTRSEISLSAKPPEPVPGRKRHYEVKVRLSALRTTSQNIADYVREALLAYAKRFEGTSDPRRSVVVLDVCRRGWVSGKNDQSISDHELMALTRST